MFQSAIDAVGDAMAPAMGGRRAREKLRAEVGAYRAAAAAMPALKAGRAARDSIMATN